MGCYVRPSFSRFSNIFCPCGPNWAHLGPWARAHLGPLGPSWAHLGPIWAHLGPFGPIWAQFGPIWAHMGPYIPICPAFLFSVDPVLMIQYCGFSTQYSVGGTHCYHSTIGFADSWARPEISAEKISQATMTP